MANLTKDVEEHCNSYDFIDKVTNVKWNTMFGADAVEVELWANVPADTVRQQMLSDLKTKFPGHRFNIVFFHNVPLEEIGHA